MHTSLANLEDVGRFLIDLPQHSSELLVPDKDIVVTRAPGRLDVMGGIADYCGSLVLEATLSEATIAAIQKRGDDKIVLRSVGVSSDGLAERVNLPAPNIGSWTGYHAVRSGWELTPESSWAAYVAGCLATLVLEGRLSRGSQGLSVCIVGEVPLGSGVSSSASLEVAVMCGLNTLYDLNLSPLTIARFSQVTENHIVGAPCGIMDQITSAMGSSDSLLALRCQPHTIEGFVELPSGIRVVGINSNVKHSVGGSLYTDTRVACFMGHSIIVEHLRDLGQSEDPTSGYLCRLSPDDYLQLKHVLPTSMGGEDFLQKYGGTVDRATRVAPETVYKIRHCTEHPIFQNDRVEKFRLLLEDDGNLDERMSSAGELMYGSHWSYSERAGLGAPETDRIVDLVRERGVECGLYGVKITGGGSGGTVAVLCRTDTDEIIEEIAAKYQESIGISPQVLTGSSPGACEAGHLVTRL